MTRIISRDWRIEFPVDVKALLFDEIDSTNTFLKEHADQNGEHLTIAVTKTQTAGRGRGDRTWISSEGNVFWSILLRPEKKWPSLTSLPLILALAVKRTLAEIVGSSERLKIKWPNDVILDEMKVSGMLLETCSRQASGDCHPIEWCVAGIGINVSQHPEGNMNYAATDLHACGVEGVTRDQVIQAMSKEIVGLIQLWSTEGFSCLKNEVESSLAFMGEKIDVAISTNRDLRRQGTLLKLTEEGFAQLDTKDGIQTLSAGEVFGIR